MITTAASTQSYEEAPVVRADSFVVMMNSVNPGPQAVMALEVLTAIGAQSAVRTTGP